MGAPGRESGLPIPRDGAIGSEWDPTIERFTGYAEEYDKYRPKPPHTLLDFLCEMGRTEHPKIVVDLGCGPGVSTRVWADRTESVIGVEPAPDMLRIARNHAEPANVEYVGRLAHDTGLAGACADIVTCGMSLHWMEPDPTTEEIIRLLRPEGVFAAYSYHWHSNNPTIQLAYGDLMKHIDGLGGQKQTSGPIKKWPRRLQEETLEASGAFRLTRDIYLHSIVHHSAQGLVELIKTYGVVRSVVKRGLSDEESGLAAFREVARAEHGSGQCKLYVSWHLWVAVK